MRAVVHVENVSGEDRVLVRELGSGLLIVVADGTGGMTGGAAAAQAVVDAARDVDEPRDWLRWVAELDAEIAQRRDAGETTAVVAWCGGGRVRGASVGDSEAVVMIDGEAWDLTAEQRRKPLLGTGRARPVAFDVGFARGRVLVATDGLFKYAGFERIREACHAGSLEESVKSLIRLPRLPNGAWQDDVAVVLAE